MILDRQMTRLNRDALTLRAKANGISDAAKDAWRRYDQLSEADQISPRGTSVADAAATLDAIASQLRESSEALRALSDA